VEQERRLLGGKKKEKKNTVRCKKVSSLICWRPLFHDGIAPMDLNRLNSQPCPLTRVIKQAPQPQSSAYRRAEGEQLQPAIAQIILPEPQSSCKTVHLFLEIQCYS